MKKEIDGITLIALIITIIILLILAGVTIATLTGENGILTQARNAREKTEIAEIIEKAKLDILAVQTENNGEITEDQVNEILAKYGTISSDYSEDEGGTIRFITTSKGYVIKVLDIWKNDVIYTSGGSSTTGSRIKIQLDITELAISIGESRKVTASVSSGEDLTDIITWESEDENVATVDQDGNILGKAEGTTTIKVISNVPAKYKGNSLTVTVTQ